MDDRVGLDLLLVLDIAAFERNDDGSFRPIGLLPKWFDRIYPDLELTASGFNCEEMSPFLAEFIIDAEPHWATSSSERLSSGLWIEPDPSGNEYGLEASAICVSGRKILLVQLGQYSFREKQHIIRAGRALGLQHERLEREEEELRLFNIELEQKLVQSQKMEAVGRLAGGIAHDFNNMLTIVNGYSELIIQSMSDDDPLKKDIKEIKTAGLRAAALTRQLLAFSRRQVLAPEVLDPNFVVTNIEQMLRRLIGEDIEFAVKLNSDAGRVKADPGQLEQVLMNLAVNARDAMPDGGVLTIEISVTEWDDTLVQQSEDMKPGPYVVLTVSDTGIGMNEEVRSRIFEPFFTTKDKGKGTGLGMATVYGIVKQSGGDIHVYSEPGAGTTFRVYLPRVDEVGKPKMATVEQTVDVRGSETVLVVEDDDRIRAFVSRVLKNGGYKVLEASHGDEALAICRQRDEPPHLLLTDVIMPKMSGRELADRLVKMYPQIEVLYMSGYTDDTIAHHGVLEPGLNFISKPFPSDDLVKKVREILDGGD